jgi:hypothetical protein
MKTFMKNFTIKFTIGLVLLILLHTTASAQRVMTMIEDNYMRYGLKAGVNFTSLYTRNVETTNMLRTIHLGGFARVPVAGGVSIQPELLYTLKGAEVTYNDAIAVGIARYNLHYIEVPLLLLVKVTPYVNVHAGPFFSFLLMGNVRNKATSNQFDFERNVGSDNFNKLESGIAAGAALDMGAFGLGLRYSLGLTKIGRERIYDGTNYIFPDSRSGTFSLYVSFAVN